MYIYTVYRTTNLINHKEYIGVHKTKNPNDSYLGSGHAIEKAIKKYGKENFKKEVLFIFDNPEDMITKETELVNEKYVNREDTYNLVSGGKYRDYLSEETLVKMSESMKGKYSGENHPLYGKHHSEEACRLISDARKELYSGENHPLYGKHHSEETKNKISQSNKGRLVSEETRKLISEILKNKLKIKCKYCLKEVDAGNYKQYHGINCKHSPTYVDNKILCEYCDRKFDKGNYTQYHGQKCKNYPFIDVPISQ